MIEDVLPAGVRWAEAFTDPPSAALFPEEEEQLARAVDKRRREYTTARLCARRALADLGVGPVAIVRGEKGQPQWPPGIVGSITHCGDYRAAAVARTGTAATVGIDAEPNEPLPQGVLRVVSRADERRHLDDLQRAAPGVAWDRLLFCAKEATYKAWFPLTGEWLGFDDAEVAFDLTARTFATRLLVPGPLVNGARVQAFPGRWTTSSTLLAAAVTLPA